MYFLLEQTLGQQESLSLLWERFHLWVPAMGLAALCTLYQYQSSTIAARVAAGVVPHPNNVNHVGSITRESKERNGESGKPKK